MPVHRIFRLFRVAIRIVRQACSATLFSRLIATVAIATSLGASMAGGQDASEPKAAEPNPPVVTADTSSEKTAESNSANSDDKAADPDSEAASSEAPAEPPTPLFDGTTLKGWRAYSLKSDKAPLGWSVDDGALAFSGKGDDLITAETYEHFELTLEFKLSAGTNSGVLYRVRLGDKKPYMSGPEFQIHDKPADEDLMTSTGALYAMYPSQNNLTKPVGEWNTAKIVVQGEHIEHWLNGTKVVDVDASSDEFKQRKSKSKFNGWPQFNQTKKGHIGLQAHGHPVWFRNIAIRELAVPK